MATAEASSDEDLIEKIKQVFTDNITEEDVRDVNGVFELNVLLSDCTTVETFFVNLKHG